MFYNIKTHSLKIFLLACLFVLCACDNRKGVCIEADDFGFEDIERFDVLSFRSPTSVDDECSYRVEASGFSSSNKDLNYCLNGAKDQSCEESYDGYIEANGTDSIRNCRFLNNDSESPELQINELSCIKPDQAVAYKNKGCNFSTTSPIVPADYLFAYNVASWAKDPISPSLNLDLDSVKNQCITSCVERCRKKRACSHVASRLPIKSQAAVVGISDSVPENIIFNPYTGTSILKHNLDGNLFVATTNLKASLNASNRDKPIYTFTWNDNGSELTTVFGQLKNPDNKKKLALAIVFDSTEKQILIDSFDSCTYDTGRTEFTCIITLSSIVSKDKFTKIFSSLSLSSAQSPLNGATAVAIFDYIKIKPSGGIDTAERRINTDTQHHFGTNSILEIVNSGVEYKIKLKEIINSKSFIYDDISVSPAKTINDLKNTCERAGVQCFLIPSVENIDSEDKFMPPWKATTLKVSPNSSGGLQISAGSKIEIQATGNITLGGTTTTFCHKVPSSTNNFSLLNDSCSTPQDFLFTQQTQYKPDVSLNIASVVNSEVKDKLNFYRSLTDLEKQNISHRNADLSDLCQSLCYIKIQPASSISVSDFACDTSNSVINNNCHFSNGTTPVLITTEYQSQVEQVRIANYSKRVIVAAVSPPTTEALGFSGYGASTEQNVFTGSGRQSVKFLYSSLKSSITEYDNTNSPYKSSSTLIPLYVEFIIPAQCEFTRTITDDTNKSYFVIPDSDIQIVYPNTTLNITTEDASQCNSLKIIAHPFILFTATQSGFVEFNTQNSCSLKNAVRVVNNNKNYPPSSNDKTVNGGQTKSAQLDFIFTGNRFVDAIFNKIANKIFTTYRSFATIAVIKSNYNAQGENGSNVVCESCFTGGTLTLTNQAINCPTDNNGCGGSKVNQPTLSLPLSVPENGKQGKVVINFLDGELLEYNNEGIYHLTIPATHAIAKITMVGGGGGAAYSFTAPSGSGAISSYNNNGKDATLLIIEKSDGFTIGNHSGYKSDETYTLKIIVGAGGKNSTEVNPYRFFAGGSHRESEDYALYKKNFGYAGGGGEVSVIALAHPTDSKKILQLAVAGGGGGGSGRTCNDIIGIAGSGATLVDDGHILDNADYDYLRKIVKCPGGGDLQKNAGSAKLDCNNLLASGFPGYCPGFSDCVVSVGSVTGWSAYQVPGSSAATLRRTLDIDTFFVTNAIACASGYFKDSSFEITYACSSRNGANNALMLKGCYPSLNIAPSLWLDASNDNTIIKDASNKVGEWFSLGKTASSKLTQATLANQPTYNANGFGLGKPAISFDAANSLSATTNLPLAGGATTYTLIAVHQPTDVVNSTIISQGSAGILIDGSKIKINTTSCSGCSLIANNKYITAISSNSTNINFYHNQSTPNQTTATTIASASSLLLGDNYQGNIAELLIYNTALTAAQINGIQNYLATKWSLPKVCNGISTVTGYTGSVFGVFTSGQSLTCDTGYTGTITVNCPTYGGTALVNGSCTINTCTPLANSDYATTSGVYNDRAICNGNLGFGSSTSGSHPVCRANGTWSAYCQVNLCSVNTGVAGYDYTKIGGMVPYGGNRAGNSDAGAGMWLFGGSQHCLAGYTGYGGDNQAVYICNNKNSDGTIVAIDPGGCIINTCTVAATTGYNLPSVFTYSYTTTPVTITGAICASGYSGTPTVSYTCNNTTNTPTLAKITASGCTINTCTAPSATTGYTLPSGFTYSYTTTSATITGASCASGYSGSPTYTCSATSVGSSTAPTLTGCTINSCTAPSATTGYNLPSVFTYSYTTTPTAIAGASCASGYSGAATMTYTCNNTTGTTTPATISASSGCTINQCTIALTTGYTGLPITINHSQNSSTINCATGYSKNTNSATYTCNNTATTGSVLTINPNHCALNTCTIANATGNKTHNATVTCDVDYGIVGKQTAYAYCPTDLASGTLRTAQNGGGSVVSCQLKFYEQLAGDFNEGSDQRFLPKGDYNLRYLQAQYGTWWTCNLKEANTCRRRYDTNQNLSAPMTSGEGYGELSLHIGNNICGGDDPVSGCSKKGRVWVGYCLRGYCLD